MTKAFRVAFGAYVAVHFGSLVPYAAELFSREGMMRRHASPIARARSRRRRWATSRGWRNSRAPGSKAT